ncbi:MAG: MBL fold metallo-hydrolase [Candidatus Lokiarchaeota archaeon]|nr:MBL fold metallo-hydrolase [Candidatus Lokiarchaeota archaeon]MBD3342228.1 MBL fold metallo-hydrolase [Candidatus Lokiarchaeota archaeon]
MNIFQKEQHVCKVCGFNMIGYHPDNCPFCGASKDDFMTAEQCAENYQVKSVEVNEKILQFKSYPPLGLEHAAYQINTSNELVWIDCPSSFSNDLDKMDKIMFTHHHFLGASNLYRRYYDSKLWIHKKDSKHNIAQHHTFDQKFKDNFSYKSIEAFHIDGHTPGFTFYLFQDVIFVCDYIISRTENLIFNPYGPVGPTKKGALQLQEIIKERTINYVCGYDDIQEYKTWKKKFDSLLNT